MFQNTKIKASQPAKKATLPLENKSENQNF